MDQEPEFYVSPEDLEAQMTAEERGEDREACFCSGRNTEIYHGSTVDNRLLFNIFKPCCIFAKLYGYPQKVLVLEFLTIPAKLMLVDVISNLVEQSSELQAQLSVSWFVLPNVEVSFNICPWTRH